MRNKEKQLEIEIGVAGRWLVERALQQCQCVGALTRGHYLSTELVVVNIMSSEAADEAEEVQSDVCCANCGVAEIDNIKLKECDGCDLVKYCGDNCRVVHREQQRKSAKNVRLSYLTENYSDNPMVAIMGSVRSASCRCRLMQKKLRSKHAAAN